MFDIAGRDNGKGGTGADNNREYGGYIDGDRVIGVKPGNVVDITKKEIGRRLLLIHLLALLFTRMQAVLTLHRQGLIFIPSIRPRLMILIMCSDKEIRLFIYTQKEGFKDPFRWKTLKPLLE